MHLHFEEVFKDAYVIYLNNERVGFLSLKADTIIQSLDIEAGYVDILKEEFLDHLLFQLGEDKIYIMKDKEMNDWYKRFGFRGCNKKGYLKYSV